MEILRHAAPRFGAVPILATSMIAGFVTIGGPANANDLNKKCLTSPAPDGRQVCIEIFTDDFGNRDVYGYITGTDGSSHGTTTTYSRNVAVQQCDGTGATNCGAYSATATQDYATHKPVLFGHTYRTMASWKDSSSGTTYGPYLTPLAS